ncbi:hypothetical protein TNCV_2069761 [Trichonephila clavipes]|uniref:Uncharacterized protein n=1 Tax=Trichonephila clavipes TaxID=2585209 RepID=A0A8X6W3Y8_TRICX|nr:hypothetical protein TNCV_2069761 [Trichonephila clavipes]
MVKLIAELMHPFLHQRRTLAKTFALDRCNMYQPLNKGSLDKNDNPGNLLKTPSAENAIYAIKQFTFPTKTLIIEPVLPYILEEWISKNIPAKYRQNIRKIVYSV